MFLANMKIGARLALGFSLVIGMMLIAGAFRVVAGVHWPSDVIAGWSLGVVLVAAAVVVRGRFTRAPASAINAGL